MVEYEALRECLEYERSEESWEQRKKWLMLSPMKQNAICGPPARKISNEKYSTYSYKMNICSL